ncbi:hypothetical protein [Pedobacter duraquae]|uniref:Uncharacterized protein n=1 Tax=Pedobacter duraquae TaxID=425511 RepID=A0A4R6IQU4_9SPHI|nr:hypothetical protein [Pedobacter duraquae]TDO24719.1 hypothetical protein CLV32_1012 [Pedobacter duraquae]
MNYEEFYEELIGEIEQVTVVLKAYDDLEDYFMNTRNNRVTYESYVLNSLPKSISDIIYILGTGNLNLSAEHELRNTLKNNTRLAYTKRVLNLIRDNREKVIATFKTQAKISNEALLINLKNDLVGDLTKNQYRVSTLQELMRK